MRFWAHHVFKRDLEKSQQRIVEILMFGREPWWGKVWWSEKRRESEWGQVPPFSLRRAGEMAYHRTGS